MPQSKGLNGRAVFAVMAGGILLYSGISGKSVSGAIRNLIMGKSPSTAASADQITGTPDTDNQVPDIATGLSGLGGPEANRGSRANQALGKILAAPYGWSTGNQWNALVALWDRESGWSNTAQNPNSTAYGIAQFLDTTWATVGGSKSSNASTQIILGLKYIRQRYGSPVAALEHENANGWY